MKSEKEIYAMSMNKKAQAEIYWKTVTWVVTIVVFILLIVYYFILKGRGTDTLGWLFGWFK